VSRDDEDPRVVDLRRYRKAAEDRRTRARNVGASRPASRPPGGGSRQQPGRPAGREPILGAQPRAGLILALVVLVLAALWFLPQLSRLLAG
jgi:hypothetical protein